MELYEKKLETLNRLTEILRSYYDFLLPQVYAEVDGYVMRCSIQKLNEWLFVSAMKEIDRNLFFNFVKARFVTLLEIERLRECLNY